MNKKHNRILLSFIFIIVLLISLTSCFNICNHEYEEVDYLEPTCSKDGYVINKCKLCGKEGPPIYTSIDYKMVPLCLECYKKNRKPAKNKYKKLMNKLSNKGYVWVLNIGDDAFNHCGSLMDVVIPYGVTNIGSGAFAYCGNLTTITIPGTVECIGDQAFMKCKKLTIKGYADSCAQKYAKSNKIHFVAIDDTSL